PPAPPPPPPPRPPPPGGGRGGGAPRLRLLLTAERLYAERGHDAVSLREICRAAGNGNNNAVQYHFGDEAGLLRAIVAYRVGPLDQRRAALLAAVGAAGREPGARELLDVLLRPLAEEARRPDSHYVRFLRRFGSHPPEQHPWWSAGEPAAPVGHEVTLAILDRLTAVPEPLRRLRLRHATIMCLTALADYDRLPAPGPSRDPLLDSPAGAVPYERYVTDLFDMASAALTAPASPC
ncbi:TetR family transcriptional regulator, partial [Frankia sp. CN6]